MLIFALEALSSLLIVAAGWSQVVVPLWRGTPLLPWLRPPRRLQGTLREAREEVDAAALADAIRREKEKAARIAGTPVKEEEQS